ncbi:conserved hypothetical protein [Nitrosococcus halophilus Nc 4]|uniref:Rap1a immunity protein domain-containing protein n=1 Tax=Nitrosococcus halophilus (strain Nc4) TaxID=472759 RepID=D5C2R7_NITHN|nr:Rap1a/Tai family immunity protein [Nitrosococcus halophilus]ADE16742.1 conserved hypothetical protein [Nitrosococcus halophilus Nc 4]
MANHKFKTLTLGLWLYLLLPQIAWSDFQNGNQLLKNCTAKNDIQAKAYCIGYVAAIADVLGVGDREIGGWYACLPSHATQGDVVEIAVNWLKKHPSVRGEGASDIAAHALAKAFPCTPTP